MMELKQYSTWFKALGLIPGQGGGHAAVFGVPPSLLKHELTCLKAGMQKAKCLHQPVTKNTWSGGYIWIGDLERLARHPGVDRIQNLYLESSHMPIKHPKPNPHLNKHAGSKTAWHLRFWHAYQTKARSSTSRTM